VVNSKTNRSVNLKPNPRIKIKIINETKTQYKIQIVRDGVIDPIVYTAARRWADLALSAPVVVEAVENINRVASKATTDILLDHECNNSKEEQTTEPSEESNPVCEMPGTDEQWRQNCLALINNKSLPLNAIQFALEGLKRNSESFKTRSCYKMASPDHRSMMGLNADGFEELLSEGIPNKCTMIINNLDERLATHGGSFKCQMKTYYIDLCSGEAPIVKHTKAYLGYGSCKNKSGFKNQSGQGTTLLGFFVSHNKTFNFGEKDAAYKKIAKDISGMRKNKDRSIPSVALFGLQNSNNGAAPDYKYLHVGAYTSAGCPSILPEDYELVERIAAQGPSVVVNYKEGAMEPFEDCESDSEEDSE